MGHLWLIGMMGSGKTTVGVLAAQILERPFLDTDTMIMSNTGRTIPELFDDSEAVFRDAESAAVATAAVAADSVIASGGGSILSRDNVAVMEESGTIVLLDVDAASIAERVEVGTDRPLLPSTSAIEQILGDRTDVYSDVAQRVVSTVGRSPQEIAMEVASCVDM
jgi:shikimate kinase